MGGACSAGNVLIAASQERLSAKLHVGIAWGYHETTLAKLTKLAISGLVLTTPIQLFWTRLFCEHIQPRLFYKPQPVRCWEGVARPLRKLIIQYQCYWHVLLLHSTPYAFLFHSHLLYLTIPSLLFHNGTMCILHLAHHLLMYTPWLWSLPQLSYFESSPHPTSFYY